MVVKLSLSSLFFRPYTGRTAMVNKHKKRLINLSMVSRYRMVTGHKWTEGIASPGDDENETYSIWVTLTHTHTHIHTT